MTRGPLECPRVLVAGVGNIFLGDDAFGVEVVTRLARRPLPTDVRVVDFGIRGLDLTYALLDPYEAVVLVDATPRGGPPGTLYVLEPETCRARSSKEGMPLLETHDLDPRRVLQLVASLGGQVRRLVVVGCEPGPPQGIGDESQGLSNEVQAAVDEAVRLVEAVVRRLLADEDVAGAPSGGQVGSCNLE